MPKLPESNHIGGPVREEGAKALEMALPHDGDHAAVPCFQGANRHGHVRVPLVDQHPLDGGQVLRQLLQERALVLFEPLQLPFHRRSPQEEPCNNGDNKPRLLPQRHRPHQAGEDRARVEVEERQQGAHVSRSLSGRHHLRPDLGPVLSRNPSLDIGEDPGDA